MLESPPSPNGCTVCKAAGGCPSCRGAGTLNGKPCRICRGSGACPVCGQTFDPCAARSPSSAAAAPVIQPVLAASAPLVSLVDAPITLTRWGNARLTYRAVVALLFLGAFYTFALGTIAALVLLTWLQLQLLNQSRGGGGVVPALVLLPPLGALAIFVAIMPRGPRFGYPGRGLSSRRAPELFELLRDVARQTRQKMPRAVYLVSEPNAFVANRGLFLGRAIGLGLPLFEALTIGELRAVVAHEFGHHANRTGPITTTVFRATRTFAAATVAAGAVPFLDGVVELWTELFLTSVDANLAAVRVALR